MSASSSSPWWSWLVTALVPVALVLAVVRLLLTPLFIQVEYRLPCFPPDPYGFSTADRLRWADLARQYLLNDADRSFVADLRMDDHRPLFNEREVRHLEDVKAVVQAALRVGWAAWAGLLVLGLVARRRGARAWRAFRAAVARGGWLTVALMGAIIVAVAVAFGPFFVFFHRLFFEGDSWLFATSDSLIRLFPERFWVDAFLATSLLSALAGWLCTRWAPRASWSDARAAAGS